MSEVVLSSAVRSNLLNLQSTAELLGKTQTRLATGKKVNSALDNPTNFFTASSLNSRAADLGRLLDSVSNAIQTIAAADKGITAITKLVESAQATARQALQTTLTTTNTTSSVTAEATTGAGTVDLRDTNATVSSDALANDTALDLDGSTITGVVAADDADDVFADGSSFTISDGTTTHTIEFYDSSASGAAGSAANTTYIDIYDTANTAYFTVDDITTEIDDALTAAGVDVTFSFSDDTTDGTFNITATNAADTITLTAGTVDALADMGFTADDYAGTSTDVATLATAGATLVITAGSATDTLDFTGMDSVEDIEAAVAGLSVTGLSFSFTNGALTITAADDSTTFEVEDGANAGAAAFLGIDEQEYEAGNAGVAALTGTLSITVGDNDPLELDFDALNLTAQAELEAALADLEGATATISATTGFLTITTDADSEDSIVITGGAGVGLANDTYEADIDETTAPGPNPKREELRVQYNELLTQIDALAKDAGFNGVNLLNGDNLSVLFNEDGTSKLDITGVTYNATGIGLSALVANDFNTNASINATLDDLKAATDTLRTQSSKFGSNLSVVEARQNFTKEMINVLETGAANLTLADSNEEAANLLALQTRQLLSSTALSLASQADQNVLRLF